MCDTAKTSLKCHQFDCFIMCLWNYITCLIGIIIHPNVCFQALTSGRVALENVIK